jgi:hypothetical protein
MALIFVIFLFLLVGVGFGVVVGLRFAARRKEQQGFPVIPMARIESERPDTEQ